jgi:exopolysaccharide biosynthesis protein
MNDNNWATNQRVVTEKDINALNDKKKQEEKLIKKHNYKWYKIKDKLSVLVPYDKDGNITPKGKEIIKRYSK